MPSATTPAQNTQATKQDSAKRIKALSTAVNNIDSLSQEGFGQISAIARLAILSFETPEGHYPHHSETLAVALSAVRRIADDIENLINSVAEEVGANHIDEKCSSRRKAHYEGAEQYTQIINGDADSEVAV